MRLRAQDRINNETEHEREARLGDMRVRAQQRHQQQSVEEGQSVNMHAQYRLTFENETERE